VAENPRIDDLRRKLERDPGSRLFAQLAEELRKDGDLEDSIRVARAGLAHHPNYPSARMTLGRALYDAGNLPEARLEFETVLRGAPDNILASRFLAECLEALGDLGSALLQYRAALRLAPGEKMIEAQIRALEQRLTPHRKPGEAGGSAGPSPVGAPTPRPSGPPVPAAAVDAGPPEAAAATLILPPSPPPAGPRAAAPAPPAPPIPPASPPAPAPRAAGPPSPPIETATRAGAGTGGEGLEESFELEAPFGAGSRLHPAEVVTHRALEEDLEAEVGYTLPKMASPEPEPPRPDAAPYEGGTRPLPAIPRSALSAPAAPPPVAAAPPPAAALAPPTGAAPVAAPPAPRAAPPTPPPVAPAPAPPVVVAPPPKREPGPPPVVTPPHVAPAPVASRAPHPPLRPLEEAPAPATGEGADPASLSSATLAELYFRQGFADKAAEVYRQLLQREPDNARARARLEELSASSGSSEDERTLRRQAIERTIARLEELLETVRRKAAAGGVR
jgi:tetratricopeptide (TPR) repeat protein